METAYDKLLNEFGWLTDLYALDYVVENHWSRLPRSWQKHFDECISSIQHSSSTSINYDVLEFVEAIIQPEKCHFCSLAGPFPLSFIALKRCISLMSISRKAVTTRQQIESLCFGDEIKVKEFSESLTMLKDVLPNHLRHKIKAKKEHEIERLFDLLDVIFRRLPKNDPWKIVDIGSGIGHLSRVLAYLLQVNVTTIEANEKFVKSSLKIDGKFARFCNNNLNKVEQSPSDKIKWRPPNRRLTYVEAKHSLVDSNDNAQNSPIVLAGLHACGDLSATIIRNFVANTNAKILISVGCCYHKLNGGEDKPFRDDYTDLPNMINSLNRQAYFLSGFPLSQRFRNLKLSYASRDLACFSVEYFRRKLRESLGSKVLFVNSYRAILEWLLLGRPSIFSNDEETFQLDPTLRHRGLHGVKNAERMDFWAYANETLRMHANLRANIMHLRGDANVVETVDRLIREESERILVIYTLRQTIAPLLETIIVEDRRAFLHENSLRSNIAHTAVVPLFNCAVSPRNFVVVSIKKI